MNNLKNKKKSGFALVETIFYVSLFAVLALALVSSIIAMARSFKETSLQASFAESSVVMERMSREVRKALSATVASSNDLQLSTTDDDGIAKTVEFKLVSSNLQLIENSVVTGNLNPPNMTVLELNFTYITTTAGGAIKIALVMRANNDSLNRSIIFYDTVGLRGSY